MTNLFQPDGKLYNLLDRLYQLLVLNFLVILTCLPLVTIGAALTAAYGTAYRIAQHKEFLCDAVKQMQEWGDIDRKHRTRCRYPRSTSSKAFKLTGTTLVSQRRSD